IFQVDSELVKLYLTRSENIKVIDDPKGKLDVCVIYFSSNEIYYPNTPSAFRNAIIKRDKYEWQNSFFPGVKRHILVRDLQKQWYVEGVSSKWNSPDLLLQRLRELCSNYMIYTIGCSAGGFGAILFGSLLNAKKVYSFNGNF